MHCFSNQRYIRTNQPAHLHTLKKGFVVCVKKKCTRCYRKCSKKRFWSDCANTQDDLNLHWPHMSESKCLDVIPHILLIAKTTHFWTYYLQYLIQSNRNHSNTDGLLTMAISNSFFCPYEILPITKKTNKKKKKKTSNLGFFFFFYHDIVCCVYLLETPHRGDSNE